MNKLYRSLMLMLLAFASLPLLAAEADEEVGLWFEAQAVSGKKHPSAIVGYYGKDFEDSSFGFYVLAFTDSSRYSEFYAGPTWRPFSWLQVGAGIGRENVPGELSSVRRNYFFDAKYGKVSVYGAFEDGGSGRWRKVTATYAINDWEVGVMDTSFLGRGPLLKYNFTNKTQLWVGVPRNRDTKETAIVLGINKSF